MEQIPARLHVLLAQKSPKAVVIRRGPSKRVAVIGWDRSDDSFETGQWLKGKIYPFRSDISPDGSHWIYFAMGKTSQTWTAVAKTPYLKALDFYTKGCAWNGGGLFSTGNAYWLNDGGATLHECERKNSGYAVVPLWGKEPQNWTGECPLIYFYRLERDGWKYESNVQNGKHSETTTFSKKAGKGWQLCKQFHGGLVYPAGKAPYYESHILRHVGGEEIHFNDMEWADIDGERIVWAEKGKIMAGKISKSGLRQQTELFDTNPLVFEEKTAPY